MIPTRIERDPLSFRISLSVLVLSKDGHSFLVMLHVSMDFHLRFASLVAKFPASSLSMQGGMLTERSVSSSKSVEPFLASSSAFSLPGIPSCPGTQQSDTLCCIPRQHLTSFDLISVAVIAFIAAWLSIKKVIPSCGIAFTADSRAAAVTAKTSAWKTLLVVW